VTSGQRPTCGCWPKAERLLEVEAEAILADPLDGRKRAPDRHLGEITSALIEAGLIAAGNPAAARLATLCHRLGVPGPGPAGVLAFPGGCGTAPGTGTWG
jgi:hypothetical protein